MNAPALAYLETAGLIRPAADSGEPAYSFRHALGQDAAYASLLRADRRRLHRAVAETLEGFYPDRLDDLAPVLADHFIQAAAPLQALYYSTLAGDGAARKWAHAEAIRHYSRALELARLEEAGGSTLIPLVTRRGRALELSGDYAGALAGYNDLHTLGVATGDAPMELAALIAQAGVRVGLNPSHNWLAGEALCAQALVLARALGDQAAEARILWILMLLHGGATSTAPLRAVAYGEESLALARRLNLAEQVALTLNDLAYNYLGVGQMAQAQAALSESRALLRAQGNLPLLADNLTRSATGAYMAGDLAGATSLVTEGYALSQAIGNGWGLAFSCMTHALILLERDDLPAVRHLLVEGLAVSAEAGFVIGLVAGNGYLGVTYALAGDLISAQRYAQTALGLTTSQPAWRPHVLRGLALIQLLRGAPEAALLLLREAALTPAPLEVFTCALYLLAEGEVRLATSDALGLLAVLDALAPAIERMEMRLAALHSDYYRAQALALRGHAAAAAALLAATTAAAERLGAWRLLRLCRAPRGGTPP